MLLKTSSLDSSENILITSFLYQIKLAHYENISISSSSFINTNDSSSWINCAASSAFLFSSASCVDLIESLSISLLGLLLPDLSDTRKYLSGFLSMAYSSIISSTILLRVRFQNFLHLILRTQFLLCCP